MSNIKMRILLLNIGLVLGVAALTLSEVKDPNTIIFVKLGQMVLRPTYSYLSINVSLKPLFRVYTLVTDWMETLLDFRNGTGDRRHRYHLLEVQRGRMMVLLHLLHR